MKIKLELKFVDFWSDFDENNNFFYNLLKKYYDVTLSDTPDLLFFSTFGNKHLKYKCKKIFYTGENIKPDFSYCDYAFSYENNSHNNFCLPHLVEFDYFFDFKDKKQNYILDAYQKTEKTKFCSFMATNPKAYERIKFVRELMNYKKVDCSGPVLYNMQSQNIKDRTVIDWRTEKLEIIKDYKFTIAFENQQANNYVTEKIYQPFLVKSIPIYWGAPNINDYFNPKCFINVSDFASFSDAIQYIKKIDQDEELYKSFFEEHPIPKTSKLYDITEDSIYQKVDEVLNSQFEPVGKRKHKMHMLEYVMQNILLKMKNKFQQS